MKTDKAIRIVLASDSHELHRELDMPDGDLFIFAGDLTMFSRSRSAIEDFNLWLGELPYKHVICVCGHHDMFGEVEPDGRRLLSNATVLINESVVIDGLRIWGSPVMPMSSGAFSMPTRTNRAHVFAKIPDDTDILVTHVPPLEIGDHSPGYPPAGCPELLMAVLHKKPKLHVFGHVHAAHGISRIDDITFVNASLLGREGDIANRPIVMKMQRAAKLRKAT